MRAAQAAGAVALAVLLIAAAEPAAAQEGIFAGMQKGLDFTFGSVSTKTTFASGLVTKTETRSIFPSVTLNTDALLFPSLRLNAGGVFEVNMVSQKLEGIGADVDSTITRNRPFVLLRSTNPVFSPGVGYFRREDRARTASVSDVKLVNDEYAAYLGWNPVGGPRSDFQFLRTHTFDGNRAFQDVTKRFGTLISDYLRGSFGAAYRGSYLHTDDRLTRLESTQITHGGRVSESAAFINKRLLWNGSYNITRQDFTSHARGTGGEVVLPVTAFGGLSGTSATPSTARLTENRALIDAVLTAGAGVNLGLPTPPADALPRNIGLDFVNPAEVNRLLVWIDRDLPFEIASTFSWEIYTSDDNIVWTRNTLVPTAPFGPFENRFEIVFPAVTARYLKVVTRPLSIAVPDAGRYTDILVTEMQAFVRRAAGETTTTLSDTTHLVNTDVRMRLLDAPSLFYEGFYLYNGPDTSGRHTDTLSNGLSLNHTFSRMFAVYARASREQGTEPRGHRVATVTNATFTATPIPTFRSSVLYTGQDERVSDQPGTRRGLFIQNSAQVYRGVDVLFGIGWNQNERESGEVSHDRLVNASATIVPRNHVSLTFSYDDTDSNRSGTFVGNPDSRTRRAYGAVAVDPVRSLHLVVGHEVIVMTDQKTRRSFDLVTNWAPFPDGTLQLIFAHNEALRALDFGQERSTLGAVRWNLSRRSYVDVSYQRTRSEFTFQKTESRIFSISVRLFA